MQDALPVATIAELAEGAYDRCFDSRLIALGNYGKPGEGFGRQVFYGSHYLGRIDGGRFIADSRNWPQASATTREP